MIVQKAYVGKKLAYRAYHNGHIIWDLSDYALAHLIAALNGHAAPNAEIPEVVWMHTTGALDGAAFPEPWKPDAVCAVIDDAAAFSGEARPRAAIAENGAGTINILLMATAAATTYGQVFGRGQLRADLSGYARPHPVETVYGAGTADLEDMTGYARPHLVEPITQVGAYTDLGDVSGSAIPQTQEPDRLIASVSAELAGSAFAETKCFKTITFMCDGEVLYTQRVLEGYDGTDPVSSGSIDAPTKAPTAQYTYTYSGWSLTDGGEVDADALSNITEDTVVYAVFAEHIRYYNVYFYDETTLVDTVSVPYGGTAKTTYVKKGYKATWSPSPENITEDTICYGQFGEFTFASASWSEIAEVSEAGLASSYFSVGDTKSVVFTHDDGTTEILNVAIAGFDHDDLFDGSGKAGISIVCMTVPTVTVPWSTSAAFYPVSTISDTLISWENCLPSDLSGRIKAVIKKYDSSYISGSTAVKDMTCTLWPLTTTELGYSGSKYTVDKGTRYELFPEKTSNSGLPTVKAASGSSIVAYWVNVLRRRGSLAPYFINTYKCAVYATAYSTTENYIRFGFCI